ncbi:MAG: hypothetical protein Q7R82_01595 [Candidatus Daviesbacteria bacterium]|nr:hypothetical protein [Candidatus Daviesbacteria bacterium]
MMQKGFVPFIVLGIGILMLVAIGAFYLGKQVAAPNYDSVEGKGCGGIAGEIGIYGCPSGYKCQYQKPMYPDAQGKCVNNGYVSEFQNNLLNKILSTFKFIN